jgi:hypothetical protein
LQGEDEDSDSDDHDGRDAETDDGLESGHGLDTPAGHTQEEIQARFPCGGHPDVCLKPFCFACAAHPDAMMDMG